MSANAQSTSPTGVQHSRHRRKPFHLPIRQSRTAHRSCLLVVLLSIPLLSPASVAGQQHQYQHQHQKLRPPRIKEHPTSIIVQKQEPAKLECKADGYPTPTIEWYKDNEKIEGTTNRFFSQDSLMFLFVNPKKGDGGDTGTYYCVAKNEVGKARSHNATLEVAFLREEFRVMPRNSKVALGETATMTCTPPRGHPEPLVSWLHDGKHVETGVGRFKLNGNNLVISDVSLQDEGRYHCRAKNMLGERTSPPAILKVLVKPYFIRSPEDITVMSNEDIVFHCKVGGDPLPTITWRREDGKIPNGRSQILDDKALRIMHVRQSDEGIYVCDVENSVGQISSSASLTVNSLPSFVSAPKDIRVAANNVARFECLVTGNPMPIYFWSKEGTQVLMFPGKTYGKFNVTNDGTLIISNVAKEDQSFYICSAVSNIGSAITRAYLSVMALDDAPPPIIRYGAADQTLPQNTKAFLPCEAAGYPQPVIKWYFEQAEISNNSHYAITPNSLQIQNIQHTDSGVYTCIASSSSGVTTWSSKLSVESPRNPNIIFHKMPDSSMFPEPPSKPMAVNQTDTSITVRWDRFGSSGASSHIGSFLEYFSPDIKNGWTEVDRRITEDIFTVRNLRPNTRYLFIVRAENKHGIGYPSSISDEISTLDSSHTRMMDNADISQARVALNDIIIKLKDLRTINSVTIKLFWHVIGNTDLIEGYYVRYQNINDNLFNNKFNMVTAFGGSTSSIVLNDLKKHSKYQFFIVPFYKNIEGKASNTLMGKTYEDVPSAPPNSIIAKAINTSCAVIEWKAPPDEYQNGNILGYNLEIYENNTVLSQNLTLDYSFNSIILYNLTFGSFYTIRALAFTSVGNGPFSQPIFLNMDLLSRNAYDDIQFQPSYQSGYIFNQIWFYVFLALIIIILVVILVKIVHIYFNKKNKPIYEKACSLTENYSDNFPKYDSNSSKYSSFQDNNEYAEVNDLKNYGEKQDKGAPVAYAMTPLIDKTGDSNLSNHVLHKADELTAEELLHKHRTKNYSNISPIEVTNSSSRMNYLQRCNKPVQYDSSSIGSNACHNHSQVAGLPPRNFPSNFTDNEYETAEESLSKMNTFYDENDFDKKAQLNEFQINNVPPITKYIALNHDSRPLNSFVIDPSRASFNGYKDSNKLSTFRPNGSPNGRIIQNPMSKYESSSDSSSLSRNDSFSNHYLVSEDVSKLSHGNFFTGNKNLIRPDYHSRFNTGNNFSHPPSNGFQHGTRRSFNDEIGKHNHHQLVKSKVSNSINKKHNVRAGPILATDVSIQQFQ